jgi:hypothetical protein
MGKDNRENYAARSSLVHVFTQPRAWAGIAVDGSERPLWGQTLPLPPDRTVVPLSGLVLRLKQSIHSVVMAGLVPAIHQLLRRAAVSRGCPAQGRGMTVKPIMKHLNESEH